MKIDVRLRIDSALTALRAAEHETMQAQSVSDLFRQSEQEKMAHRRDPRRSTGEKR